MSFERWLYVVRLRLRTLFRRDRVEDELGDEVRFHLDERARQFVARGMSERDARDAALGAFGGVEQRKEEIRDARRMGLVEDFVKDVRYALRMMRRAPGFTAVAVISLAVGIGANTAIFSAIDVVMLRRLPIAAPDELLQLQWTALDFPQPFARSLEGGRRRVGAGFGSGTDIFPYATFTQLRARSQAFSSVFAFSGSAAVANVGIGRAAESARVLGVSGNYFSGIGVGAVVGRTLSDEDDREDAAPVAVASYGFWQSKLGGTPAAIGQAITMNGQSVTIVGIASQGFFGLEPGLALDLWIPLTQSAHQRTRRNVSSMGTAAPAAVPFLEDTTIWWTRIAGRLGPNASVDAARAEAAVTFNQSIGAAGRTPVEPNTPVLTVTRIGRGIDSMRETYAPSLLLLMGMVGLVLLIACANLAGLLLERASAREREIAVRLSLGVSRTRLVRQLLTESVTLAGLGGLGALAATVWTYPVVMSLLANGPLPSHLSFSVDWTIVAFTAGVSMLAGVVFGLAPAVRASRVRLLGSFDPAHGHHRQRPRADGRQGARRRANRVLAGPAGGRGTLRTYAATTPCDRDRVQPA